MPIKTMVAYWQPSFLVEYCTEKSKYLLKSIEDIMDFWDYWVEHGVGTILTLSLFPFVALLW